MTDLLDQPAVVLLAAAGAALFLLLEVALPTVGLAGATGLGVTALAAWGVDRQSASAENNSTIIFPIPVELLEAFQSVTRQ